MAALLGLLVAVAYLRDPRLGGTHDRPADIVLALVAGAPVALRRPFPLPAFVITTVAIAALIASGRSGLPLGTMLVLVGYMVAARASRRSSVPALVLGEIALLGALAASGAPRNLASQTAEVALLLALAWFVGNSVSARRAYLAEQAERERATEADRARLAVRDERVRIAREMHDVIAHSLAVVTVQAGAGRRLMAKHPEQAAAALESIEATGRSAQDELRAVLGLLRDDGPGTAELGPAPRLADLGALVETVRAAGTPVELRTSGLDGRLSPALELSVYRVVQEALTNVVKHAPGANTTVEVSVSAREVAIEVADDGEARAAQPVRPLSGQSPRSSSQHGILGMQERVGAFGGSLTAGRAPGHGFRVSARIPFQGRP
jgi:signal transduction histidine kinase